MAGWFRIFNPGLADWEPEKVMEGLQSLYPGIQGKFRADDDGYWLVVIYPVAFLVKGQAGEQEKIIAEMHSGRCD